MMITALLSHLPMMNLDIAEIWRIPSSRLTDTTFNNWFESWGDQG